VALVLAGLAHFAIEMPATQVGIVTGLYGAGITASRVGGTFSRRAQTSRDRSTLSAAEDAKTEAEATNQLTGAADPAAPDQA
jgi:hypothetical protein